MVWVFNRKAVYIRGGALMQALPNRGHIVETRKKYAYEDLSHWLEVDGWLSPDTYGGEFGSSGDFPAVYMFMQVDFNLTKTRMYRREIVYVGMSTRLAIRWAHHPTLRKINDEGLWVKRLFKPTPRESLRSEERRYIQQFRPRWNVIGKVPGQ